MAIRYLIYATALLLTACTTFYQPLKVDEKTGMYPTSVQVDPGGVLASDNSIDPKSYRYVLLLTDSNIRPSIFSVTARQALAQAGILRVYTRDEFAELARDRGFPVKGTSDVAEFVQSFSRSVGPVLVIDYSYQFVGDARFHSRLFVADGASGRQLLRVDHPRLNWANADAEAMYPVLNELLKWIKKSSRGMA